MALPKQVQAQLAEVEELEKALEARTGRKTKADEADEAEVAQVEEPTDTSDEQTDPETKQEAKPQKAKPADKSLTDVADDFKQKYMTLRGKYDSEVPRLNAQVKELAQKLEALEAQKAEQAAELTKAKEKVSFVTDADREEFGEELIDVQRRVAREVAMEYQEQLEAQARVIEELKTRLAKTDGQIGQMGFAQRLNQLVPDFSQVDNDARWIQWLDEYDPIVRGPRRAVAKAAFDAGDAEAVAHYVRLFKESIADTPEPAASTRQAELERQVAPNRSATSARAQGTGKAAKLYSPREVDAAWNKIRVLNTRGQVDEAAKLEAELTAAYLEGRVRG